MNFIDSKFQKIAFLNIGQKYTEHLKLTKHFSIYEFMQHFIDTACYCLV